MAGPLRDGAVRRWIAAACAVLAGGLQAAHAASWLDPDGRPSANAHAALGLLAAAADDGLDPRDYRTDELAGAAASLDAEDAAGTAAAAEFERILEGAMLRYLRDLHAGRIDPRTLGFRLESRQGPPADLAARLEAATLDGRLPEAAAALRPVLPLYDRLRAALAHYRILAHDPELAALPAAPAARPGAAYPHAAALHRLLVRLGDLPAASEAPAAPVYDESLAAGVARFQERHGLAADGVLGRRTLAALNVPLGWRMRQIELAMERLRWLPDLGNGRFIGVNIPMFRLWAWDPAQPARPPLSMAVVVGRALDTQTPVLAAQMRHVVFRPYWNVPRSIVLNEILPALRKDPGMLEREGMQLLTGPGDDAQPVPPSAANLARLQQGELRLRQQAGEKNPLGLVKFVSPNDADIYLHGTPAAQLFQRPRRDFSHGCVRVEDPVALAQWVLDGQPQWTRERIEAAMAGATPSLHAALARPLPVILFYMTAMVMPGEHALRFADDIYRHDVRLDRALKARR
jgi:murein L,D-transpeptidase YcbB/YkuD